MRTADTPTAGSLVALMISGLTWVACHDYWPEADAFQARLSCGMSLETVRELAAENGVGEVRHLADSGEPEVYGFTRQSSVFTLWFREYQLEGVRQGRYVGRQNIELSLRVNLCTGERFGYPRLTIVGPEEYVGAAVLLDGQETGVQLAHGLRPQRTLVRELPAGTHTIVLDKEGLRSLSKEFRYEPRSPWPEEKAVVLEIEAPDPSSR